MGISSSTSKSASNNLKTIIQPLTDVELSTSDIEEVIHTLQHNHDPILAVYLLSKPIAHVANGKFHHWFVKIHTGNNIFTLEFGIKEERGFISLGGDRKLTSSQARQCFHSPRHQTPITILASVVPQLTPKGNDYVCNKEEEEEGPMEEKLPYWIFKISQETISSNQNKRNQLRKYFALLPIEKKISDIATFISNWIKDYRVYNPIYSNCQRFAHDLYQFLIPSDFHSQLGIIRKKFDCPYDSGKDPTTNGVNQYDEVNVHEKDISPSYKSDDSNVFNQSHSSAEHELLNGEEKTKKKRNDSKKDNHKEKEDGTISESSDESKPLTKKGNPKKSKRVKRFQNSD